MGIRLYKSSYFALRSCGQGGTNCGYAGCSAGFACGAQRMTRMFADNNMAREKDCV